MRLVCLYSLLLVLFLWELVPMAAGQETLDAQWGDETGPCRNGPCLADTVQWTRTTEYLQLLRLIGELQQLRQYCESQSYRIDRLQQRNNNLTSRVTQLESHVGAAEQYIDTVRDECRTARNMYSGKTTMTTVRLDHGSKTPDGFCAKTTCCDKLELQLRNVTRIMKEQSRRQRRQGRRLKLLKRVVRQQGNSIVELKTTFAKRLATIEKKIATSRVEYLNDDVGHFKSAGNLMSRLLAKLLKDNARLKRRCMKSQRNNRREGGL